MSNESEQPATQTILVICAWCKKIIRRTKSNTPGNSHGICRECLVEQLEKCNKEIKK